VLSPCLGRIPITEITRALGRGFSRSAVISSASLAVLCLFYVYTAASYAEVRVYPLVDRVTYYAPFAAYITTDYADHVIIGSLLILWLALVSQRSKAQYAVIGGFAALFAAAAAANYEPALEGTALASLPAILSLIVYNKYSHRKILNQHSPELTLNHIAVMGAALGIMGLALVLVPVFFADPLPEPPVRNYAYEVYLVLSSFSPVLILLLIACVPVKLLSDSIVRALKVKNLFAELQQAMIPRKIRTIYLALIMLLSVLLVLISHTPTINPDGQQVGVDTGYYVNWVGALQESSDPGELFYQAFVVENRGDRPLSLLLLYALNGILGIDLFSTVEYVPVLLAPALALVVYFLTRELTSNDIASLFAAFITAVSFHTLIGIYAGFYANWLALIVGYCSFLFLFRFLRGKGNKNLVLYGVLTLLVLFSHVYTWSVLSIAAGIFLLVCIVRPKTLPSGRRNAALSVAVLLSVVAVDIGRTLLIGSSGGIERDLELAGNLVGPDQFLLRWNNLSYTTTTFVGGLFAGFVVLGLGIYWLARTRIQDAASIFIVIFLSLGILPFIIGEWVVQTRVFYNIPFQIPAAVALALVIQDRQRLVRMLPICVFLLLAAVVAVSNFYLVLPEPAGEAPLG
jgi:hypothetical protein